uniref:Uncharacterized protein n=1 Tax=Tetranychus urticae TaxID=32264 RepID=T1KSS5_TETUR
MVARKIDQVKNLYGYRDIPKDAKTFYNSTEQSLQLLLKSMNDTQISDATKYYSNVVELTYFVEKELKIVDVDYISVNSRSSLPRDELQAMMDAYIDDIEMVRVYEVSFGHSDRVDMEIVDRLKSLSNDLKNLNVYRDDEILYEEQSLARRAMDQCLLQLRFLLDQFTETFVFY